jgi:hypothetical protein
MFRRDLVMPDQTRAKNGDDSDLANSAAYQGLLEGILEYQQAGVLNLNDPQVMAMMLQALTTITCLLGPIGTQDMNHTWAELLVDAVIHTLGRGIMQR